jgi:hypothetical protein
VDVSDSIENHPLDVVELHQDMTPSMKIIQKSIKEIIFACVEELKKSNMVKLNDCK